MPLDAFIAITESTYCFTAFTDGYFVSEFPSTTSSVLLFAVDSLALIRFDNETVSIISFRFRYALSIAAVSATDNLTLIRSDNDNVSEPFSFELIRLDNEIVSVLFNFASILLDNEAVSDFFK